MRSLVASFGFSVFPGFQAEFLSQAEPAWLPDYYYFSLFLNAHFPAKAELGGFIAAKDDGSGGDNWSYKTCKVPVKSSPQQTNTQLCTNRMPFLSPIQQCQSTDYCYLYLNIAFGNTHTRRHLPNMIEITVFKHSLWRHFSV